MPSFNAERRVRHSPERMFDLVADVERYPEFVPLCQSLKVRRRVPGEEGVETLVAEMTVGYKAIRETFISKVALDRPNLSILVEYIEGPFRYMENRWGFVPDPVGCRVDFAIRYEFRSMALGLLMGAMFDSAFRRFTQAFETRADAIYGTSPAVRS